MPRRLCSIHMQHAAVSPINTTQRPSSAFTIIIIFSGILSRSIYNLEQSPLSMVCMYTRHSSDSRSYPLQHHHRTVDRTPLHTKFSTRNLAKIEWENKNKTKWTKTKTTTTRRNNTTFIQNPSNPPHSLLLPTKVRITQTRGKKARIVSIRHRESRLSNSKSIRNPPSHHTLWRWWWWYPSISNKGQDSPNNLSEREKETYTPRSSTNEMVGMRSR